MKHHAITFAALAALAGWTVSAQAVTEINVWHSMTGALGDRVSNLAAEFPGICGSVCSG